jgi:uncharacterized protein (TIGR04255 family)
VEAVIDFRFASEVRGESLLHALESTLGERYAGERKKSDLVEVSASLDPDSVTSSARRSPHLTFLQSIDHSRLLGCGKGVLSVHVLSPYPGWENFLDQARAAICALPDEIRSEPLASLAVRYINRFAFPVSEQLSLDDYLEVLPRRPGAMPAQLSGLHMITETRDPSDGTAVLLAIASAPSHQANPVVIYDLTVQRAGDPLCGLGDEEWIPIIEVLHKQHRDIFEGSITERMRELFR